MKKKDIDIVLEKLKNTYPEAKAELNFTSAYELLIAVMLSAQCTDKRVNKVTEKLFAEYNTPEKMITLSQEELEKKIFSCGFYHNKAKNILASTKEIIEKYSGNVPNSLENLRQLPGVGRKTANVVASVGFGIPAIAVDTHVFRVSNRIGIVKGKNELETELQLQKIIPESEWLKMHHVLIFHGRYCCHSQKPECEKCPITDICQNFDNMLK